MELTVRCHYTESFKYFLTYVVFTVSDIIDRLITIYSKSLWVQVVLLYFNRSAKGNWQAMLNWPVCVLIAVSCLSRKNKVQWFAQFTISQMELGERKLQATVSSFCPKVCRRNILLPAGIHADTPRSFWYCNVITFEIVERFGRHSNDTNTCNASTRCVQGCFNMIHLC